MLVRTALAVLLALLAAACAQLPSTETENAPVVGDRTAPVNEQPVALVQDAQATQAQEPARELPPPPPADLWERIRAGYRLPDMDGPLVREWERWYADRPDYVARMVERSSRFLYYVVDEVERRKMPAEIALLPMIESAYNPYAYSRAHASGMWQFIPSTARLYGLRQTYWYDGRRDPLAATGAALDYLESLHGMFGSWDLALAAYNWGEGGLSRAIARNQARGRPATYGSLAMPRETRNYLPKLQAVKNLIADPARFGLELAAVPNEPYFATVTTQRHIDVTLAARLAEMPEEEFRFLNPAHNKPVIRADGSEVIVLPRHKVETFQRNLEAHDEPLVSWQAYTVKRSDKPEKIAAKHGLSLARLKEVNGIPSRRRIVAGQTILVPMNGSAEPHLPDLPAPKATPVRRKPQPQKTANTKHKHKPPVTQRGEAKKKDSTAANEPATRAQVTKASPLSGNVVAAQNAGE